VEVNVLIDAIVRQTTVLIAQLATTAGGRAPLVNTANKVFVDLVRELKEQGLGHKVIADMFGLALRTYHGKIRRLSESTTVRGRSIWEAVLEYIQSRETVSQADVLVRFAQDDELTVRGVLTDLVESGMVFRMGRGDRVTFRAAKPEEYWKGDREDPGDAAMNLAWVAVGRFGPVTVSRLLDVVPLERPVLEAALERLVREGHVTRTDRDGTPEYASELYTVGFGTPGGWEAAVFDHYQALVTAICAKLRRGPSAAPDDRIGGSTYAFSVWEGHPHHDAVMGLLGRLRQEAGALREAVTAFNATHSAPEDAVVRVLTYLGQTVLEPEDREEEA